MDLPQQDRRLYVFGRFSLDRIGRTVTFGGDRVPLSPRLFDTLLYLVERQGAVVARESLLAAVWPGRVVDDGSVGRAVSSLRAALKQAGGDDGLIVTVPGRGYRFGAAARLVDRDAEALPDASAPVHAAPSASSRGGPKWRVAIGTAVMLGLCAAWLLRPASTAPYSPPPHSVAVLPFANLSADAQDAYIAEGLADDLIDGLAAVDGVRVAARRSSFRFQGTAETPATIGRRLGVAQLLEGSVRREGQHIRVHAELTDVAAGFQLWSRSFERDSTDMLAVEREIAEAVVTSVKGVLEPKDASQIALGGTASEAAYYAMLQGLVALEMGSPSSHLAALSYFNRAIAEDPRFALAYVNRATADLTVSQDSVEDFAKNHEFLEAATRDAEAALALAPTLAVAHAELGLALCYGRLACGQGIAEENRAIAISPDNARVLRRAAFVQMFSADLPEAERRAHRATQLDPLSAKAFRNLAIIYALAGRFDEAQQAQQHASRLAPNDPDQDRLVQGTIELYGGRYAAAAQSCRGREDIYALVCLAIVDHAAGRLQEAEAVFAKLRKLAGDNGAYQFAEVNAVWQRKTDALEWLQKAYRLRDPGLPLLLNDPLLITLRQEPAFREIAQAIGLLQEGALAH